MNKHGFTLIELIVYMGVLSLFTFYIFDYWIIVNKSMISSIEVPTIGLEVLRRDLAQASSLSSEWSLKSPELVFIKKRLSHDGVLTTFSVGWKVNKKRLVRSNGVYNFNAGQWIEKRSAVVSKDVQSFTWRCTKNCDGSRVEVVELWCAPGNGEFEHLVVRLRNRIAEGC